MDTYIYGADTETLHGQPMTLQFYSEDCACDEIIFVDAKSSQKEFLRWCGRRRPNTQHVVYVHNLDFDLPELLYDSLAQLALGDFDFSVGPWTISGVYGGPTFCRIKRRGTSILVVDSFSYFRGSLLKAANLFCPLLPKLPTPKDLGAKKFTARDTSFVEYAMRDAVVAYHIGKSIEETVRQYDIPQPVSVADLAGKIFRRHFVKETIQQPPLDAIHASLRSYHGGKNNWLGKPAWHMDVQSLDIKSAYPYAGTLLPAFSDDSLFRNIQATARVKSVPDCGVYCVSGIADAHCQWPALFSHGFKPLRGNFEHVWIQGQELNEALHSGEVKIRGSFPGWIYDADRDTVASPFAAYFETFYALKEREPDKIQREKQKFILNSLTGKLIQTRKGELSTTINADTGEIHTAADLVAGGLCHPFAASFITANTRARIHSLEHQVKAIHTATDGVFARQNKQWKKSKELGSITFEGRGDLLILRNKLYIFYAPEGSEEGVESEVFLGRRIVKYAKHGYQGTVSDLEKMVVTGERSYHVTTANRLRSSLTRGRQVNAFEGSQRRLNVGDFLP